MRKIASWTVLLIALAAAGSMAQSATASRDIVLDLDLPNGAAPRLRITEGGTGTVDLPKVGKFGFVPTLQAGSDALVVVELYDLGQTPHRRIARLELTVGGDTVRSATKPEFGVRVSEVLTK